MNPHINNELLFLMGKRGVRHFFTRHRRLPFDKRTTLLLRRARR